MVRFLVFTDLHTDAYADAKERLEQIIQSAKKHEVDFIVSIGDLCYPTNENRYFAERLSSIGIPVFHTIGNHDTQSWPIEEILSYWNKEKSYDSFKAGEYKFIFLDANYYRANGVEVHYPMPKKKGIEYPVLPKEQMEWLDKELSDGMKYVIFSHQSLVNDFAKRGISNRDEVKKLFKGREVLLCMNGHDHGDDVKVVDDTIFYTVNASSGYCWFHELPQGFEIEEMPYLDALHVIVELQDSTVNICGMESRYKDRKPEDVGVDDYRWNGVSILPRTGSYSNRRENV